MPAMLVKESIDIEVSAEVAKAALTDFTTWPVWSPWLIFEPDVKLSFSPKQTEVGSSYTWKGDLTGQGEMEIESISDRLIQYKLQFLKPFKQKAKVWFDVKSTTEKSCQVAWGMDSKLPFFMFPMVKKLSAFVAMDYRRGLSMLKDQLEHKTIHSSVEITGIEHFAAEQHYVGIKQTSMLGELSSKAQPIFDSLVTELKSQKLETTGPIQAIYEELDPVTQKMTWIAAAPVAAPQQCAEPLSNHVVPAELSGVNVEHTGEYKHLGNAWAAANAWVQNTKGKKPHKSILGRETYFNAPGEVEDSELKTKITMFVRS